MSDTLTKLDLTLIPIYTRDDTIFLKKLIFEQNFKNTIKVLATDFNNHPKINTRLLVTNNIYYYTITSKKFYSFFGKKNNRIQKGWEKIYKKYGTRNVIEFSRVKYKDNYASVYYELHCGVLCGVGEIVIFEKVGNKWRILTSINLWMS